MLARKQTFYTPEEYLALEEQAESRSEYVHGEIYAMAGGSANHNLIAGNFYLALRLALAGKPCNVFIGDVRLLMQKVTALAYPDVMVICNGARFAYNRTDTVTNPTLIVEVLSPSTRGYDRGDKFAHYRTLDTLQDYVMVDQERVHVEHLSRVSEREWRLLMLDDPTATLSLASLAIEIPLEALYRQVDWTDPA